MSLNKSSIWYRDFEHTWIKQIPFVDTSAQSLFVRQVAQPLGKSNGSAWVFDIDSTLLCLGPRMQSIYLEFLRAHPRPAPHWLRALEMLKPAILQYNIEATFASIFYTYSLDRNLALSQAQDLWAEFYPFWVKHFYSDRHLHHDRPYPGAVEFVQQVRNSGRKIVFLTGRNLLDTGSGTRQSLQTFGFGIGPDDLLLMKNRREEEDLEFKERASRLLSTRFEVETLIDNEPENLVMFARVFNRAAVVLFHSVMSHRIPTIKYEELLRGRTPWRINSFQ